MPVAKALACSRGARHGCGVNRTSYLSCADLANKSACLLFGGTIWSNTETFDVSVNGCSVLAVIALHLADLDHFATQTLMMSIFKEAEFYRVGEKDFGLSNDNRDGTKTGCAVNGGLGCRWLKAFSPSCLACSLKNGV